MEQVGLNKIRLLLSSSEARKKKACVYRAGKGKLDRVMLSWPSSSETTRHAADPHSVVAAPVSTTGVDVFDLLFFAGDFFPFAGTA